MERDDSVNALSVIEEGDEQDLNAEAFADMAMSGMDMNLELNTMQIDRNGAAVQPSETQTKRSAYEELKNGAVHYSRREDKMQVLQEHPVVASVSTDGRSVGCRCGRSVRLNPPWYILKFEQHVASRNCTFLRQSRPRKRKRTEDKETGEAEEQRDTDQQETQGDQQDEDEKDSGVYSLQSVDAILRREFGVIENGQRQIKPPPDDSPNLLARMFKGAMTLRENPHFKRITPDGKFVECKCSRIVLLGAPWQPGHFLMHVADKQKPKKRAKPAATAVASAEWKNKRVPATARTMISHGVLMRPPTSASALLHAYKSKKSFPRDIRWDVARARGLLPCPGLRDERMNTFVTWAIQLTGGARHRQKIARELFPHLFPDNAEYDHRDEAGHGDLGYVNTTQKRQPKLQQLLEAEKLLLHDVIEGEALWFVDKDGNSVRSLDCLGVVESSKGVDRCLSCTALRSNVALRTAAAAKYKVATRPGPPRNPINRKFCSGRVCALLEAEFDMQEPYARVLRDLALADIPSALNTWMEMATMGLSGDFDSHSALLGLIEAMVRLKDKEQRGVGLQNMTYSDLLDSFMRSLAELSSEACELFQRHLGGRKQKQLLAATPRPIKRKVQPPTARTGQEQQPGDVLYDGVSSSATVRAASDDGFAHLLDPSVVGLSMPPLSIGDIQDVDLTAFPTSSAMQNHSNAVQGESATPSATVSDSAIPSEAYQLSTIQPARQDTDKRNDTIIDAVAGTERQSNEDIAEESKEDEEQMESDPGAVAFLSELTSREGKAICSSDDAVMPTDHVPCTGLRDDNVQAYVSNAVQVVGGSRPRYVIARELFPQVFGNDKKVRIVDKLNEEQRLVLQDAVFSECLWRVDKEGRCVRSLRCKRFVPVTDNQNRGNTQSQGVCRACRDLRTVPNFRSVLSRSKIPKKLENIKYVPSVYTESDPFLRKLSKNSAFRGLYQTVKHMVSTRSGSNGEVDAERVKQVHFWLRFARMGVFGHFKSHPVFEGLMKSMVEMKDKQRRGVGKQNMQYSRALDEFMQSMAQISTEAFELFAGQFCGRTLRSQKVKRRSTSTTLVVPAQTSIAAESAPVETNGAVDPPPHQPLSSPTHQHYLMPPDDLLDGRSLSSEESQRFMDRMLDEVRLSVSREMFEEERRRSDGNAGDTEQTNDEEDSSRLGPDTYLDDDGVLTTEI
ncbi:hypothetical protein PInf_001658 [Phytophthora infestans]|nr:hypothetical protein PInf_001658 [Phytophthora infestans]